MVRLAVCRECCRSRPCRRPVAGGRRPASMVNVKCQWHFIADSFPPNIRRTDTRRRKSIDNQIMFDGQTHAGIRYRMFDGQTAKFATYVLHSYVDTPTLSDIYDTPTSTKTRLFFIRHHDVRRLDVHHHHRLPPRCRCCITIAAPTLRAILSISDSRCRCRCQQQPPP